MTISSTMPSNSTRVKRGPASEDSKLTWDCRATVSKNTGEKGLNTPGVINGRNTTSRFCGT